MSQNEMTSFYKMTKGLFLQHHNDKMLCLHHVALLLTNNQGISKKE